jgi:hypothetical protein
MPDTKLLDKSLGSRHRAALGITEETDAVVVVVSEERGTISFCFNGNIISNLDGASLRQALLGLFGQHRAAKKKSGPPVSKKDPSRKDRQTGSYRISVPPSAGGGDRDREAPGRVSSLPQPPSAVPSALAPSIVDDPTPSENEMSVVGPRPEPAPPRPMAQAPKIDTPMPSEPEE